MHKQQKKLKIFVRKNKCSNGVYIYLSAFMAGSVDSFFFPFKELDFNS